MEIWNGGATGPRRAGIRIAVIAGICLLGTAIVLTHSLPTLAESDTPSAETNVAMLGAGPAPGLKRYVERVLKVRKGDTLMRMMVKAGVSRSQAHAAIKALRKVYDPRGILPGQNITLSYDLSGARPGRKSRDPLLQRISIAPGPELSVLVERNDTNGFTALEVRPDLRRREIRVRGVIRSSLYHAGIGSGLPRAVLADLIRMYSWDVDFQRDLQPGDTFELVFERHETLSGRAVRDGDILYSALVLGGKKWAYYRFEYADGSLDYFDEDGQSARKPLLRTPIDGARLSSRYGKRRHPILGYTRMHRGVDFAAARGTPIYAAGDGVIVYRGRNGSYGKYIRIRHNSTYTTAYGHLKAYRRGLKRGSRVKQGQIIGYVGTTGLSSGPHLHYEVLVGKRQTNPLRLKMPSGRKLTGKSLKIFQSARAKLDGRLGDVPLQTVSIRSN